MGSRAALAAAAAALLLPGLSLATTEQGAEPPRQKGSPAECARLHKQIAYFEGMVERAEALDNELWAERTEQHVELLRDQQRERCPDDAADSAAKAALVAFANLLKAAGKAALTYFTFGAF